MLRNLLYLRRVDAVNRRVLHSHLPCNYRRPDQDNCGHPEFDNAFALGLLFPIRDAPEAHDSFLQNSPQRASNWH